MLFHRSFLALALAYLALALTAAAVDPGVRVITHPSLAGDQVKRQALAAAFLSRSGAWSNGLAIVPVDQSAQSSVRAAFSAGVLAQPVAAVQLHWVRRIASGARPPLVKVSDADVIAFVAATPGAVGYVSIAAPVDASVKELRVID